MEDKHVNLFLKQQNIVKQMITCFQICIKKFTYIWEYTNSHLLIIGLWKILLCNNNIESPKFIIIIEPLKKLIVITFQLLSLEQNSVVSSHFV